MLHQILFAKSGSLRTLDIQKIDFPLDLAVTDKSENNSTSRKTMVDRLYLTQYH